MIEVEIKAKVKDIIALKESLVALGFAKGRTLSELDIYFNGNDRDFRNTDEALRIRTCKDMDAGISKNVLTYKGPKLNRESQTRQEFEITFENPAEMQEILSALGYSPILEVRKLRKLYHFGEVTACVDCVDSLGDYLELEKLIKDKKDYPEAVGDLYEWLARFGISKNLLTQYSYLELLLKQNPEA